MHIAACPVRHVVLKSIRRTNTSLAAACQKCIMEVLLETAAFTHSISNSIKTVYKRRLFYPLLYLALLAVFWIISPVSELAFVRHVSSPVPFQELQKSHAAYVSVTLSDLHFTGYTQKFLGFTSGYYYYTFYEGQCVLVLLSPSSCEAGLPDIEKTTVHVRILKNFEDYEGLTASLAGDLEWTASGIQEQIPDFLLSEPGFNKPAAIALLSFFFLSGLFALMQLAACTAYILNPLLSPACRHLGRYGDAKVLLAQAEAELDAMPQLAAEDIYITENFFIVFADDQTAVVPIREIIWVYKHSTLHKFLWYHFSISYTLHITANRYLYLQCPKNMQSDIDGILSYLCEANPEIAAGFSEENRRRVQSLLGTAGFARVRHLWR